MPVTIIDLLKQVPEPIPEWLDQKAVPNFDRDLFFGSRTVYYPGYGDDGHPVKLCARSHTAHTFVYVDYGVDEDTIIKRLRGKNDRHFRGYKVEHSVSVKESTLRPGGWRPHAKQTRLPSFATAVPFGRFVVLRRKKTKDASHGPRRLAILFIGGDGSASYDALYCQDDGTPAPYMALLQDYGFGGGNYSSFGDGGLLHKIACACAVFPEWLLVGTGTLPWEGYVKMEAHAECGGMHAFARRLFLRRNSPLWGSLTTIEP